ncbi:MAG: TIR domain-containing protein [Acidithiobacillus sp.]
MGLPRTFIGFSSTDIHYYNMMLAWKGNEHIYFDFTDCQLQSEVRSDDENYIKAKCRERINMSGTYLMLIGADTRSKHKYVRWEAEVAMEKGCRIIGVNLDNSRSMIQETCPPIIRDIGAVFVPYSPKIIAHALEGFCMGDSGNNYHYPPEIYLKLGYK